MSAPESGFNQFLVTASPNMDESSQDGDTDQLTSLALFDSVPTVREPATVSAHLQTGSVDYFDGMRFPSPSLFDDTPTAFQEARAVGSLPSAGDIERPLSSPPAALANAVRKPASETERWEDLPCIRVLNRFHEQGGVDDRGYHILYRMCQLIWAVGHEVKIRKKVKLPRAQRLAKSQQYFDALYEGAKLWQRNTKARIRQMWDLAFTVPRLDRHEAFQDLELMLNKWHEAMKGLYFPSTEDANLFYYILDHYRNNYSVLYALHREKPDYGLRNVLPTADKVFKLLIKLPDYCSEADLLSREYELHFSQALDRYSKDRARQEEEVAEFDAMPPEDKLAAFVEYMRRFQPGFVREVNDAPSSSMSQEELNNSLEDFRNDFLERIADSIKHDEFYAEEDDVDVVEYQRTQQLAQMQREARETRQGWLEALGLDPDALPIDDDDDDQSAYETVTSDMFNFDGEPLPEDNTLAHLLRRGGYHDCHSKSIVDWKRPGGVHDWPKTLPQQAELRVQQHPSPTVPVELPQGTVPDQAYSPIIDQPAIPSDNGLLFAVSYPSRKESSSGLPQAISKSFAAVEDDLVARGHQRSSTVSDISYTTSGCTESDSPRPATSFQGRAINSRRHGVHVPRIFTGSLSQLETDIRRLQLDKVKTPESQPDLSPSLPHAHDCKVRDFAITPQISPSPTPSPATLLFRREALLSKETELQDRFINGQMVRSRRPSTKTRAHTVEEATGGLEAWLSKNEGRDDSPTLAPPMLHHPDRKHTI